MLNLFNYPNQLTVNGVEYCNSAAATEALAGFIGDVDIFICGKNKMSSNVEKFHDEVDKIAEKPDENKSSLVPQTEYKLTVRQYMTKPSSPGFDFMAKWNKDTPMPLRTMVGVKLEETRGMIKFRLHGQPFPTSTCIKCGRVLKHPVSLLYGVGPECGGHLHINPYNTKEELEAHYETLKEKMSSIVWEGWIIKTAITDIEEIESPN